LQEICVEDNSMADTEQTNLTVLTVDLLSAYVANNTIQDGDLPALIRNTHAALKAIETPEPPAPAEPEHKPAVSLRKSTASRDHIISLIDGKPYQTLKRHLSKHGLTPAEYRGRYGLPADYPMVAPAYSDSRRAIAETLGLGRRVKGAQVHASATDAKANAPEPTDTGTDLASAPANAKAGRERGAAKGSAAAPARTTAPNARGAAKTKSAANTKAPRARKPAAKAGRVGLGRAKATGKSSAKTPSASAAATSPVASKAPSRKRASKTTAPSEG
jgi:predicted transcriptional regulator